METFFNFLRIITQQQNISIALNYFHNNNSVIQPRYFSVIYYYGLNSNFPFLCFFTFVYQYSMSMFLGDGVIYFEKKVGFIYLLENKSNMKYHQRKYFYCYYKDLFYNSTFPTLIKQLSFRKNSKVVYARTSERVCLGVGDGSKCGQLFSFNNAFISLSVVRSLYGKRVK